MRSSHRTPQNFPKEARAPSSLFPLVPLFTRCSTLHPGTATTAPRNCHHQQSSAPPPASPFTHLGDVVADGHDTDEDRSVRVPLCGVADLGAIVQCDGAQRVLLTRDRARAQQQDQGLQEQRQRGSATAAGSNGYYHLLWQLTILSTQQALPTRCRPSSCQSERSCSGDDGGAENCVAPAPGVQLLQECSSSAWFAAGPGPPRWSVLPLENLQVHAHCNQRRTQFPKQQSWVCEDIPGLAHALAWEFC
jgi:hypothetical protein